MSITKIHAIKSTVSKSIDYICDPEKTEGETLIFSHGTVPEYAAASFDQALKFTDKNDPNLAYHLIQSFAPGEVEPNEAHEIGKELAERLLGGRYSYVLARRSDGSRYLEGIVKLYDGGYTYNGYQVESDEVTIELFDMAMVAKLYIDMWNN